MADWDNKEQVDATEDEPIELTDIISTDPDSYEEEEPVELMDIIEKDDNDSNPDIMDIIQVDSEKNENENEDEDEEEPEAFFDYKDKYLKMDSSSEEYKDEEYKTDFADVSPDIGSGLRPEVKPDQLEAALERVIEKQYADKIESLLLQAVEKVMAKEIAELKESIQKDFEKMGGVK